MKRCYIDVETTGTNPAKHGIIQLAGKIVINGVEKNSFDFRMKPFPGQDVEEDALMVTGTTREMLETYMDPREAYRRLLAILGTYVSKYDKMDKFHFVAYNASFDDSFAREWFKNCGDKYFGSWFWWPAIDVAVLAAEAIGPDRALMANFKLTTVADWFKVAAEGSAHDALYDITLTQMIHAAIETRIRPA
jgi:DNA polymerase-3 subunit epsilon